MPSVQSQRLLQQLILGCSFFMLLKLALLGTNRFRGSPNSLIFQDIREQRKKKLEHLHPKQEQTLFTQMLLVQTFGMLTLNMHTQRLLTLIMPGLKDQTKKELGFRLEVRVVSRRNNGDRKKVLKDLDTSSVHSSPILKFFQWNPLGPLKNLSSMPLRIRF